MLPGNFKITTELLCQGALFFAMADAILVPVLVWRIPPDQFRKAKWILVLVAGLIWFGIWCWTIGNFWETVYAYVFPVWGQYLIPPVFGLLMALVALGLWSLALRLRSHPVWGFILFGGIWGICTHVWAVFRGIVKKPPMLQGASPVAAIVIAFFEYIFYWCIILSISALLLWGSTTLRKDAGKLQPTLR